MIIYRPESLPPRQYRSELYTSLVQIRSPIPAPSLVQIRIPIPAPSLVQIRTLYLPPH
uniref:Uncharacterized protein n=1 Tax=Anguilla anguilla TaxID=7936 RepID=A0A0E9WWN0_ANGAN